MVERGQIGAYTWLHASRAVPRRLAPYVRELSGYEERCPAPLRRREFPAAQIVVILEFGPPLAVFAPDSETERRRHSGGFVAGIHDGPSETEHGGYQAGVQLDLTPLGARRLFGLPLSEIAGHIVDLDALLPAADRKLAERLAALPSWDARFDAIEAMLDDRVHHEDARARAVAHAVTRIETSGGQVPVATLAHELGCSHRHLIELFRDQVGVTPKQLARVARIDALLDVLRARQQTPQWAALAAELGFCDQSHLSREVKRLCGVRPTQLGPLLLPFGG